MASRKPPSSKEPKFYVVPQAVAAASSDASGVPSGRVAFLILVFALASIVFFLRLFQLQVVFAEEYSEDARASRTLSFELAAPRGTIYDRNGNVLAKSVEASSIYVDPREINDVYGTAVELARVLGGKAEDYEEKLAQEDTSFVYIERQVEKNRADPLKELQLEGIHFLPDTKRMYPYGQIGGQVVGLVNIDNEGLTGLELYYDDILGGTPGKMTIENGRTGIPIPGAVHEEVAAIDGEDIIISLDVGLQQYLEERIAQGAEDLGGTSGNSVVLDSSTGEILACASTPYFNPADPNTAVEGSTQLKSITNAIEPGSVFKTVSALAVLEAGRMKPEDTQLCPVILEANDYEVSDAFDRGEETMTLRQILARSSNVGISLAVENKLGFEGFNDALDRYGLVRNTGVDYPGESSGWVIPFENWSRIQGYNMTFGQGITVTPLQMANFYAAIRNGGVQITPHFLIKKPLRDGAEQDPQYEKRDLVTNDQVLSDITGMLEAVVQEGTGTLAQIEGFAVAGKTSTAEIADVIQGGYKEGLYNICFTGFLPHSSSPLVCFVGVEEVPGDRLTTPLFKDIMEFAIERYRVVPDVRE